MLIKIDENLPAGVVQELKTLGHDADSSIEEGLGGCDDRTIWQSAQARGRLLITQDLDFSDARQFLPGTHHGIVVVRLRQAGRNALTERLRSIFQIEDVETWSGCLVVVSERKIRVRRP